MKRIREKTDSQILLDKLAVLGLAPEYRTWTGWRSRLGITSGAQRLSDRQKLDLVTFAALRKQSPRAKLTILDVRRAQESKETMEWLQVICMVDEQTLLAPCKGEELPQRLFQITGIKIAEPTLYEWGRKAGMMPFSRNHYYSASEVGQWVRYAERRQRNKQKRNQGTNGNQRTSNAA